jgi:pSer/pThr/pTyr-binding forkhead associated (FHA) protein
MTRYAALVLERGEQRQVIRLQAPIFLIGRHARCHLRPGSAEVSAHHCALLVEDNRVLVRDLQSRTGTLVNERALQGQVELQHGDRLKIGPLVFRLDLQAPDERAESESKNSAADPAPEPPPPGRCPPPMSRQELEQCDSANYQMARDKLVFADAAQAAEALVRKFHPAWLQKENYLLAERNGRGEKRRPS